MPAINQAQIMSLPDILGIDRYTIQFGSVPGVGDTTNQLTLRCLDVSLPGFQNEAFPVDILGQTRMFRGRKKYDNTLSCTFIEGVDMGALGALRNWHENVVGTASGDSTGYSNDYSVNAVLQVYDTTGAIADNISIYGVFPFDVPQIGLSSQQTQMMQFSASFHYNWVAYSNTPIL